MSIVGRFWAGLVLASGLVSGLVLASPVAPADPLPGCDKIGTWDEGDIKDCQRVSADHVGLRFEGRTTKVGSHPTRYGVVDDYLATVKVLAPDGTLRQTVTEPVDRPFGNQFFLRDLDGDGRDELVVMTGGGGTGGVPLAVWRAVGDETTFQRAGTMFGFLNFWKTADGFIAQYAHAGAGAGSVALSQFEGHRLDEVARLDTQALDWTDNQKDHPRQWVVRGDTKCAVTDYDYPPGWLSRQAENLSRRGIDPATASEHFCSEPWVAALYGGH